MTHSLLAFNQLIEWHAANYITNIRYTHARIVQLIPIGMYITYSCMFTNHIYVYKINLWYILRLPLSNIYAVAHDFDL